MLFNSIQFLVFLPIVIILYYMLPYKYRWVLLLVASYYFYMCWNVKYIILIVISTLVDYFSAIFMAKASSKHAKKKYLIISLISNLGLLFFFKYFNFFSDSINSLFYCCNLSTKIPYYNILLPVGISFYTFQTLSYTIDVYRGKVQPIRHIGIFAVYVSYFPQLVAGPIERSASLIPQLTKHVSLSYDNISKGFKLIILGFFLKLVVADRCSIYVDAVYNNVSHHDGLSFMFATILFSFQIYGDFAGYSLIAIGSARLMGVELMTNFRRPYLAASIQEFWQRWHISLSTWFRDYVYIPLGGNRVKMNRWLINIVITFLVSGLWHGANWTFIIWGGLHGLYLVLESFFRWRRQRNLYNIILTFILVMIAWVFFRANTVMDAMIILGKIFTVPGKLFIPSGADVVAPIYSVLAIGMILLLEIRKEYFANCILISNSKYSFIRLGGYALLIVLIFYFGVFGSSQFIYFQF